MPCCGGRAAPQPCITPLCREGMGCIRRIFRNVEGLKLPMSDVVGFPDDSICRARTAGQSCAGVTPTHSQTAACPVSARFGNMPVRLVQFALLLTSTRSALCRNQVHRLCGKEAAACPACFGCPGGKAIRKQRGSAAGGSSGGWDFPARGGPPACVWGEGCAGNLRHGGEFSGKMVERGLGSWD